MKKIFSLLLVLFAVLTMTACNTDVPPVEGTVDLRLAINHQESGQPITTITYQRDEVYVSTINGKEYRKGDLLPVWEEIGKKLDINFIQAASATDTGTDSQWARFKTENFAGTDLINHNIANLTEEGLKGNFVDLSKHLDKMPNFKKILDENPSVKSSITASNGAIYSTPYFDGLGEIHRSLMARIDWIEDILDTELPGDMTQAAAMNVFRQNPSSLNTTITVATKSGSTREVTKAYDKNILDIFRDLDNPTGADLLEAFRAYFNDVYADQGYDKLSEVVTGVDASYDADELFALWQVVKSNPQLLTRQHPGGSKTSVEIYFPRQGNGNRVKDLFQSLHVLFGIRGTNSFNNEWLYFDKDGKLQDVRAYDNTKFLDVVDAFSELYQDGYLPQNPTTGTDYRKLHLEGSTGFMSYDYNATSSTVALVDTAKKTDADYNYQMILPPVHDWLGDGNYFHFTESVRDVQSQSWGIVKNGIENDQAKFNKALALIDQMYDVSTADSVGTIHIYGPEGWTDGEYDYPSTDGSKVYKLSAKSMQEMKDLHGGNNTRYLRQYVGATLAIGHIRSLGLEYQILSPQAKEGFDKIALANQVGTYIYAGKGAVDGNGGNPWFGMVPTNLPISRTDIDLINQIAGFRNLYSTTGSAPIIELLNSGFTGANSRQAYEAMFVVNGENQYSLYLELLNDAYQNAIS